MKKRPLDRTKVVWRHLPPSITQAFLTEQIDNVFSGRYDWVSFCPGKSSQKRHTLSRAYIKFKRLEDVTEFAGFFNGHVFVNEKGAQFKTIVEYAPFQRVPAQRLRKDSREGTLITDPEYIEFLKFLVKPVENLPSVEIQLERREAERSGAAEGVPIVTTPLMDYVRRKRASKSRTRGKLKKKTGKSSDETRPSLSSKLNAEKRRTSTTTGALTDVASNSCSIEKATCNCIAKVEKLQLCNKSNTMGPTFRAELLGGDSGMARTVNLFFERWLWSIWFWQLKEQKNPAFKNKLFGGMSPRLFQEKHMTVPSADKHDHRSEKRNLVNQDVCGYLPEIHLGNEKEKPPGATPVQPSVKDANIAFDVVVGNDLLDLGDEKLETPVR
ncbi:regulator of nonsense transcripts UPF3-like isoform X2 [Rhodamnia argentea]|uniref:Regulator of nonsense transcripts UPF3-like isoform X2 n=1 Tax=Rhodamnia argentea TaxID=178133 RepID=A0ABM3HFG3_9MYRT|nr:regulator of nonsense transcripts UPF3-like isoform X2 [Rhodamnia argentea]